MDCRTITLGRAVGRNPVRDHRPCPRALSAPSRPRTPDRAFDAQRARQYRCLEARRLHGHSGDQRGGLAGRGPAARTLRQRRPVHRQHQGTPFELLRRWLRRACLDGRSGLRTPFEICCQGSCRGRRRMRRGCDLSRDGRTAVLLTRGKPALSALGGGGHRDDRDARGQIGARGGAALRPACHGHRLRLLARRGRGGRRCACRHADGGEFAARPQGGGSLLQGPARKAYSIAHRPGAGRCGDHRPCQA